MDARCVGCAADLPEEVETCGTCGTPAVGATFEKNGVAIPPNGTVQVPRVCACCLRPATKTTEARSYTTPNKFFKIPIPYCAVCDRRRGKGPGWIVALVLVGGLLWIGDRLHPMRPPWYIGAPLGLVAFVIASQLATAVDRWAISRLPRAQRLGHVQGCDAHRSGGRSSGRGFIILRNRAFAKIWQDLNDG
jgi:hypothetical protein